MPKGISNKTGESWWKGRTRGKQSPELVEKRVAPLRGRKRVFSEEWRKNMSEGYKGKMAWNKGRKSPEFSGENNPQWKGGITPLAAKIRTSPQNKVWRELVLKRDDYTCQSCGIRGGNKHVDHIVSFADILQRNKVTTYEQAMECAELWDPDNGRTLCVPCHAKTETFPRNLRNYYETQG